MQLATTNMPFSLKIENNQISRNIPSMLVQLLEAITLMNFVLITFQTVVLIKFLLHNQCLYACPTALLMSHGHCFPARTNLLRHVTEPCQVVLQTFPIWPRVPSAGSSNTDNSTFRFQFSTVRLKRVRTQVYGSGPLLMSEAP